MRSVYDCDCIPPVIDDRVRYRDGRLLVASCAFASDILYWPMKIRSKWSNVSRACTTPSSNAEQYNLIALAATDIAQLVIMSIGLLRTRRERRGLLRYLYIQVGGLVFFIPLLRMTVLEIGLGLDVACRGDDDRDSNCCMV